jgi:uncharacterized coiled-coil DUF342 family protein
MLGSKDQAEERPDAELRDRLHAMEAKVRKLRDIRNNYSSEARSAADQRNAIQGQYKEHKEKVELVLAEVKTIRAEIRLFKEKRNAIQDQIRSIIGQAKGRRGEKNEKKSATAEHAQLKRDVANLENLYNTSAMGPKKEKETMEKIKQMSRRIQELSPDVEAFELVAVDLDDLDSAIKTLKAEADASHQAMLEAVGRADEKSKEVDEAFSHRDFLKAEGDRHHNEYVALRGKADETHAKIDEMMTDVNKVRDELNMAREERKSWMTDHNEAVSKSLKTGAESEEVAEGLISSLLDKGTLTFGGMGNEETTANNPPPRRGGKKKMRRVDMSAGRRRR